MLSGEEGSQGLLVAHSRHCRAAVIYTSRSLKRGDEMLGLEPRQPEERRQPVCTVTSADVERRCPLLCCVPAAGTASVCGPRKAPATKGNLTRKFG